MTFRAFPAEADAGSASETRQNKKLESFRVSMKHGKTLEAGGDSIGPAGSLLGRGPMTLFVFPSVAIFSGFVMLRAFMEIDPAPFPT